jgi:hypothetical protein
MKTTARFAVSALVLTIVLCSGASVALAATVYTSPTGIQYAVPAGYVPYSYGTYYNSATNTYFNPVTGQTSSIVPTGPVLTSSSNGLPTIPFGYSSSVYGTYYATNGVYLDPLTGFMSRTAPVGPVVVGRVAPVTNSNGTAYYTVASPVSTTGGNPALPNTGAGGDAPMTIAILLASAVVLVSGVRLATKSA